MPALAVYPLTQVSGNLLLSASFDNRCESWDIGKSEQLLYRQDYILLSMVHKQVNYKNTVWKFYYHCELISIQRRNQVQSWLQDIPVTQLLFKDNLAKCILRKLLSICSHDFQNQVYESSMMDHDSGSTSDL